MFKDQLFKTSGFLFDNWLFGPEKFSALSRNRPQGPNRGEAGGKQISRENGVVSTRFDRGADDGAPVETETNGNPGSIFTAMWPPFFKNVTYY